jgi:hypothetical protein
MGLQRDARFLQQIQPRSRYPSRISFVPNKQHQLRKIAPPLYSSPSPPVSVAQRALADSVKTQPKLRRHRPHLGSPLKKVRFANDPAPVEPEERSPCSESCGVRKEDTQKRKQAFPQSVDRFEGRIPPNVLAILRLYARE